MDEDCPPGPSSSRVPDVETTETPSFPMDLNFHVLPVSLSRGYESICTPYDQENCHMKQRLLKRKHRTSSVERRLLLDFKRPREEKRLIQAASLNDEASVHNLLNRGINPSCYDSQKRTPLHVSACKGYANIVRILLERGANPHATDLIGNTALHLAACTNNIDVVLLLLKAGGDACSSDILGRSPLQLAQSKLKILQRAKAPDEEIKKQVPLVIEMLLHFSKNGRKSSDVEALDLELLSHFQNRFRMSETRHDIDTQLSDLLDNLGSLTIKPS